MSDTNEAMEKLIEKTLQLLDEGRSFSDILNSFPERQQNEAKEIILMINALAAGRSQAIPSQEILSRVLRQIPSITESELSRYPLKRDKKLLKGRLSLDNIIITKIYDFMTMKNWKIWVPVGAMAMVILAVLAYSQIGVKESQYTVEETAPVAQIEMPLVIKPATGKINDAVDTFLQEMTIDQVALASEKEDETLLAADSQEIDNFNQIYDQNEF